jgi:hypothetical protein
MNAPRLILPVELQIELIENVQISRYHATLSGLSVRKLSQSELRMGSSVGFLVGKVIPGR